MCSAVYALCDSAYRPIIKSDCGILRSFLISPEIEINLTTKLLFQQMLTWLEHRRVIVFIPQRSLELRYAQILISFFDTFFFHCREEDELSNWLTVCSRGNSEMETPKETQDEEEKSQYVEVLSLSKYWSYRWGLEFGIGLKSSLYRERSVLSFKPAMEPWYWKKNFVVVNPIRTEPQKTFLHTQRNYWPILLGK